MKEEFGKMAKRELRKALYTIGIVLILAIIVFIVTTIMYNKKLEELADYSNMYNYGMSNLNGNSIKEDITSASSQLGKTVNEISNSMVDSDNKVQVVEITEEPVATNESTAIVPENAKTEENTTKVQSEKKEEIVEEVVEDPIFSMPVEGKVMREFAKDSLVYSNTLKEWVTHTGLDIQAEKTTVVKASANGVVSAIKNDPRYGLTIIVEHVNGYETIYANLLTAEFVKVGEAVTEGQTLGTVGNSAIFEIADESHLHFEILKDGEPIDPSIYVID